MPLDSWDAGAKNIRLQKQPPCILGEQYLVYPANLYGEDEIYIRAYAKFVVLLTQAKYLWI